MKSIFTLAVLLLIGLAFTSSSWKNVPPSAGIQVARKVSSPLPAEIQKIVDNSCVACHGAGGKKMALAHVKMAEWTGYSSEKQAQKAAAMCKMVTAGKMPPRGYLKENPKAVLTQEQIASICAWSALLNKDKK